LSKFDAAAVSGAAIWRLFPIEEKLLRPIAFIIARVYIVEGIVVTSIFNLCFVVYENILFGIENLVR